MKRLPVSLLLFLGMTTASAQREPLLISGKDRYKQVSGRYGANEGICLFEDSTFLLYGYATAVFGHYRFEQEHLLFYPDKPELFDVYGTQNKSIGKGVKINFVNFEGNGRTFFQINADSIRQVFNDGANCFDAPFVLEDNKVPGIFLLAAAVSVHEPPLATNAYHYDNTGLYNDFIVVYYPPKRIYEPFSASFSKEEGQVLLSLSNFATAKGYYKNEADEDERKQWEEFLTMKIRYGAEREMIRQGIFANEHYHTFWPEIKTYDFNPVQNLYISKTAAENEAYYKQDAYNDDRYLRRFVQLLPKTKNKLNTSKIPLANTSIFYTVCGEGAENAYHYKALDTEHENKDTLLETVAPVPLSEQKDPE
ncbi:MAG: preprotein translocase subunit SecD [Sphingobacteriales bacterium]|nr:MAG: preprotein translocase subunit SecD [Sphingobacteriales bacterium]